MPRVESRGRELSSQSVLVVAVIRLALAALPWPHRERRVHPEGLRFSSGKQETYRRNNHKSWLREAVLSRLTTMPESLPAAAKT